MPAMPDPLLELLSPGLDKLGISATDKQKQDLVCYVRLLDKWNKAYNLTAVRSPEEMISRHILDSLSVLPALDQERLHTLADVGSGAGLPGIPLAIMRPHWHVTLIESNGKKAGFLRQAKTELALENIMIQECRAEELTQAHDAIICRAVSSLARIIEMVHTMAAPATTIWCMKGSPSDEELSALPKPYMVSASYGLAVPGEAGSRRLLKITKQVAT